MLADQLAVTPAGKLIATPMPVAPVVVCVILGIKVFTQMLGELDAAVTVLIGSTV